MLYNRYPDGGDTGIRLDVEEHPSHGRALDLGRSSGGVRGPFHLWVRDANSVSVNLDGLEVDDLVALRNGLDSLLHAEGVERRITVNVPAFFEVRSHVRHNADGTTTRVRAHRRTPR